MDDTQRTAEQHEAELRRLQSQESRLWRIALLFLALLATGMAAASWQNLASLPQHLEAIPAGTLILAVLFAIYATAKRRQMAELQAMMHGMQEREKSPPSEQQLRQLLDLMSNSQRSYRELIDSLGDIVLGFSLEGKVRTINRAFADQAGKTFSEIVGHNLDEFLDEPTRAQAEASLVRFLQQRQWAGVLAVRFKGQSGVRYYDTVLHPIIVAGEVAGISVTAKDVTAAREREQRFTQLFETLQEGVYFTTPEGKILDCNMALVRMLGYETKQELLGVSVPDLFVTASDRQGQVKLLEQSSGVRCQEVRLKRKDGGAVICLDTARAIFDEGGKLVRLQGALFDITDRRNVEDRLHQQEEFGRRLVESFPDLILAFDRDGRYTFVSPRIREILGIGPETLVGRSMLDAQTPGSAVELQELFHQLVSGQEVFQSTEYAAQHRDGTWRTLRATASPMHDTQGKLTGVVASVRDVTAVKQLEQQLIQTERLAAMGHMIDGFAHELNNPLTAILGAVELLEATSAPEPSAARKFELLKQQAKRAAEVVQNLLFFARPPAPGKAPLNISDMVQRSLQLHEHSLKINNIAVDFIPDPQLPAVIGDPHQVMQVFLNLIINAEQAIREIRPRGTLRVRVGRNGGRVWASFQDDGPGISSDLLPKIFDPFFTTKRPGRGTGLGLSVAMAILKKYSGTIEAQAAPGGGSVFTVTLPAAQDARPKAASATGQ